MLTRFKTSHETSFWRSHNNLDTERRRMDPHRLSGPLGGPGVPASMRIELMPAGVGMESYRAVVPFDEVLNRLRRALSRSGFEILRECDVGSRIRSRSTSDLAPQCRILYVIDPELFATAITTHVSAALWLPIPLVLCRREDSVTIMVQAELIVHDRAALLGVRALLERAYQTLRADLQTVATCDSPAVDFR